MSDRPLDHAQVRRAFSRAAATYERHDVLQQQVQAALIDRLSFYLGTPARVLDVGCGTGRGTALLKQRWPKAEVVAVDVALPMLRAARRHSRWRRGYARVCGDAMQLPFPDHTFDVVHANLLAPWCDDPLGLFRELNRVLAPGGFLAATSLGPDTLKELRAAWAAADEGAHVHTFLDMHDLGDAILTAGFYDPVVDVDYTTLTYATPAALVAELRGLGLTNADAERPRGLTGKTAHAKFLAALEAQRVGGRIPTTWEVVGALAWGLQPGQMPRMPLGGRFPMAAARELVAKWGRKPQS